MLTERELVTIRAALLYWREEMGPQEADVMRPYLDSPQVDPLSDEEIDELRAALKAAAIHYAVYNPLTTALASDTLFATPEAAFAAHGDDLPLAVVLTPAPPLP